MDSPPRVSRWPASRSAHHHRLLPRNQTSLNDPKAARPFTRETTKQTNPGNGGVLAARSGASSSAAPCRIALMVAVSLLRRGCDAALLAAAATTGNLAAIGHYISVNAQAREMSPHSWVADTATPGQSINIVYSTAMADHVFSREERTSAHRHERAFRRGRQPAS